MNLPTKLPLNLAHRGASRDAPENTLAAFRLALDMGADGVELDVHLSADRVPVVIHDGTLERTTDGAGAVSAHTVWELQQFDAGSWKDARFAGAVIPTLDEVFGAVDSAFVNIELKSTSVASDGLEEAVLACIRRHDAGERVILSSFNPLSLARVRTLAPRLKTGLLFAPDLPLYLRRTWLRALARPDALHPAHSMITPRHLRWARRHGFAVNAWTVDDPAEMRRLIALGVDGIITNVPDVLRDLLRAEAERSEEPMDE